MFIWGVRRDCVDPRFLTKEQIINHFGHASFTTKVGCAGDAVLQQMVYETLFHCSPSDNDGIFVLVYKPNCSGLLVHLG